MLYELELSAAAANCSEPFFVHNVPPLPLSPCVIPLGLSFHLIGIFISAIHCQDGLRRHE